MPTSWGTAAGTGSSECMGTSTPLVGRGAPCGRERPPSLQRRMPWRPARRTYRVLSRPIRPERCPSRPMSLTGEVASRGGRCSSSSPACALTHYETGASLAIVDGGLSRRHGGAAGRLPRRREDGATAAPGDWQTLPSNSTLSTSVPSFPVRSATEAGWSFIQQHRRSTTSASTTMPSGDLPGSGVFPKGRGLSATGNLSTDPVPAGVITRDTAWRLKESRTSFPRARSRSAYRHSASPLPRCSSPSGQVGHLALNPASSVAHRREGDGRPAGYVVECQFGSSLVIPRAHSGDVALIYRRAGHDDDHSDSR